MIEQTAPQSSSHQVTKKVLHLLEKGGVIKHGVTVTMPDGSKAYIDHWGRVTWENNVQTS